MTSLGVGGAAYALLQVMPDETLLSVVVGGLAYANLVVGVLNLVPGMPLDGGRVLRAGVWKATGDANRGLAAAGWAGRVVALLMMGSPLLMAAFAPTRLEIVNDSALHSGHMGDDGSGESHFTLDIESAAFEGVSRLQRQRMVNAALGDIPGQRVHALAIRARAPGDAQGTPA